MLRLTPSSSLQCRCVDLHKPLLVVLNKSDLVAPDQLEALVSECMHNQKNRLNMGEDVISKSLQIEHEAVSSRTQKERDDGIITHNQRHVHGIAPNSTQSHPLYCVVAVSCASHDGMQQLVGTLGLSQLLDGVR